VAIEHCKEMDAGLELAVKLRIFHSASPSLHFAAGEDESNSLRLLYLLGQDWFLQVV
jgi:hypothetical protein